MEPMLHRSKASRFGLLVITVIGVLFFRVAHAQTNKPTLKELIRAVRQKDGLHKAAILNNGFYQIVAPTTQWNRAASFEDLVRDSTDVFVGSVQGIRCELGDSGRQILTHYAVRVRQTLKGNVRSGQSIDFVASGGTITFDDGTVAVVSFLAEPPLLQGHQYALFTNGNPEGGSFGSSFADESVFEFDLDGSSVHPHAYNSWDPIRAKADITQAQFLRETQVVVQQQSK